MGGAGGRGVRGPSHVCAELVKQEEEGHYQSAHQDVMEEIEVGSC